MSGFLFRGFAAASTQGGRRDREAVNALCPGFYQTSLSRGAIDDPQIRAAITGFIPAGQVRPVTDGPGFGQPLPERVIEIGHRGDQVAVEEHALGERLGLADPPVADLPCQVEAPNIATLASGLPARYGAKSASPDATGQRSLRMSPPRVSVATSPASCG